MTGEDGDGQGGGSARFHGGFAMKASVDVQYCPWLTAEEFIIGGGQ